MLTPVKAIIAGLAAVAFLAGSTAAAAGEAPPVVLTDQRGDLVDATYLKTYSAQQVDAYVDEQGFTRPRSRYAVDLYRVIYRTIDPAGEMTIASGLVILPKSPRRELQLTSYTHGTISNRNDAASVSDGDNRAVALMFGGAGLAVSAPDYLGLGLGPGKHPFMHLASETTASADLLVATRQLTAHRGIRLHRDVMVSGFSQGGRVAVNLGKSLQQGRVPGFRLDRAAAVAGPYDLERIELPAAFDGQVNPKLATYYLAYLVTTWKTLAHLYSDPAEAFQAPYDRTVETLFDGHHGIEDILAGLPESPDQLFLPAFKKKLLAATGSYAHLLRAGDASCRGWTPEQPVRLYYGSSDVEVVPANALSCQRTLGARTVNLGPIGHFESWYTAYPRILTWFTDTAQ